MCQALRCGQRGDEDPVLSLGRGMDKTVGQYRGRSQGRAWEGRWQGRGFRQREARRRRGGEVEAGGDFAPQPFADGTQAVLSCGSSGHCSLEINSSVCLH